MSRDAWCAVLGTVAILGLAAAVAGAALMLFGVPAGKWAAGPGILAFILAVPFWFAISQSA